MEQFDWLDGGIYEFDRFGVGGCGGDGKYCGEMIGIEYHVCNLTAVFNNKL